MCGATKLPSGAVPAKCSRASFVMRAMCASSRCLASASITGPIWVAGSLGSPSLNSRAAPSIISIMRSATFVLHEQQPQRRAALAGGTERRRHDVVGDLFGQGSGIDDHRIDAAGLCDQRHDRPVLGGERAVDRPCHFGRAGECDAGDVGMRHQHGAGPATPATRCRADAGTPASCSSLTASAAISGVCSAGFAATALPAISAAVTCSRKIASWKIQRRYRDEDAPAAQAKDVALAGRSRNRLALTEQVASLRGIVAAEIHGLANFRDRIVQRLAAFALQQRDEIRRAPLQQIGGLLQHRRARRGRRSAPVPERPARGRYGGIRCCSRRIGDAAGRRQGLRRDRRDQPVQRRAFAEFDPAGICPLRPVQIARQRECSDGRHSRRCRRCRPAAAATAKPARLRRRQARQRTNWRRSRADAARGRRGDRGGFRPARRCDGRYRGGLRRAWHRSASPMPCRRWNSKPLASPPASSRMVATVSALWVANCGKICGRSASNCCAQAT